MKKLQEKVRNFCKQNDMESPIEHRVLDTVSEIGEVAKEVLKMSDYGRKPSEYREELESELGDVLYSIITIANTFDIDLEKSLNSTLEKYDRRLKKGSADSQNE